MKNFSKFLIYSIVLTVLVGFASCSKDDDDTVADPTSILTSKVWEMGKNSVSAESGDASSQISAMLKAVLMEPSYLEFKTGNVLNYEIFGVAKTGTWALSSDFKTLTLKDKDGKEFTSFQIVEATSSLVKLKKTYTKAELESTSDVTVVINFTPKA
jgi:hypothetical protein